MIKSLIKRVSNKFTTKRTGVATLTQEQFDEMLNILLKASAEMLNIEHTELKEERLTAEQIAQNEAEWLAIASIKEPVEVVETVEVVEVVKPKYSRVSRAMESGAYDEQQDVIETVETNPAPRKVKAIKFTRPNRVKNVVVEETVNSKDNMIVNVGMDMNTNESVKIDLNQKHVLISGVSGSGKSVAIDNLQTQLMTNDSTTLINMVDMKDGVTAHKYRKHKQVVSIAHTFDDVIKVIDELVREHHKRNNMFKAETDKGVISVENIDDYNAIKPKRLQMSKRVLIVDELAQLSSNKIIMGKLLQASQLWRSTGITLIVATQTPNSKTVPTDMRANLHVKLAFQTDNHQQAQIAMGGNYRAKKDGGINAHQLSGNGHGIVCQSGKTNIEFKGQFVASSDIMAMVKDNMSESFKREMEEADVLKVLQSANRKRLIEAKTLSSLYA